MHKYLKTTQPWSNSIKLKKKSKLLQNFQIHFSDFSSSYTILRQKMCMRNRPKPFQKNIKLEYNLPHTSETFSLLLQCACFSCCTRFEYYNFKAQPLNLCILNKKYNELKSTCPLQRKKYVTIKDTHLNHAILTI